MYSFSETAQAWPYADTVFFICDITFAALFTHQSCMSNKGIATSNKKGIITYYY